MGNVPDSCRNTSWIGNVTSYQLLSECWNEKWIADVLRKCLPLIILPVSLICNCLSFMALRSRHMRGTSTAFFMLALSVLDPLLLLTKNLVYFPTFVAAHAILCKIVYFLIYVLNYTNVWILVIMTADKFFAVWFPLKVSYFCTITRAKYVCVFLLAVTSVISFHLFWTVNSLAFQQDEKRRYCSYDVNSYPSIQLIWRYIDFVIWCFLPFVLILTLSVLIIYKLRQKRQGSHQNIRNIINSNLNTDKVASGIRLSKQHNQTIEVRSNQKTEVIRSRHRHITLMLLAVAVVFLLLTLPNSIYFVLDLTYGFNVPPKENDYRQWLRYRRLTILTVIMFQLSDLQHATNFFLYLLTSDNFRRSVMMICTSTVHALSALLHWCGCREKASSSSFHNDDVGTKAEKTVNAYRASTTDTTNVILKQHCTPTRPTERALYKYHSLISKPSVAAAAAATTTTEFSQT